MQFSIILPTFNRARLIARAMQSVIEQNFEDWELIIIDDGSSDNTREIIEPFLARDKRIHYYFTKNIGAAAARNLGCSFASGKYLTFLDSDDEYLPLHLESHAGILSAAPALELLHGGVEVIGDPMVADKDDPSRLIPISECITGATFFIRRDLFKRLGGFTDIPYSDDNDFFRRAQEHGAFIEKVEFSTYRYYRTEPDSLCAIVEREGIEGIAKFRSGTGFNRLAPTESRSR